MRNMRKAVREYFKRFNNDRCAFFVNELEQIASMTEQSAPGSATSKYDYIYNALAAGFMVGYRQGKNDAEAVQCDTDTDKGGNVSNVSP